MNTDSQAISSEHIIPTLHEVDIHPLISQKPLSA